MLIEEPRETDGVWEQHFNLRDRKWQKAGESYIMMSFITSPNII